MNNKKFIFTITAKGDPTAGIPSVYDCVTVTIESGDPGGEPGEFEEFMIEVLSTWYEDPRGVELAKEKKHEIK